MNKDKLRKILACYRGLHCGACRDREDGRVFRQSVVDVLGIKVDADFDCPFGLQWKSNGAPQPLHQAITIPEPDIPRLLAEITTDDPADRWIKSIIPQIQDEMKRHEDKGEPCKARRCRAKIAARWEEYLQQKKQLTTDKDSAYTVADRGGSNA